MTGRTFAVAASLCLVLGGIPAGATPLYYTFEGHVTSVNDAGGLGAYSVGDLIRYTMLVDFSAPGTASSGGSTITYTDVVDAPYYGVLRYGADYFYTAYVGGDGFVPAWSSSSTRSENYGFDLRIYDFLDPSYVWYYGALNGSVTDTPTSSVTLYLALQGDPAAFASNWGIGTEVLGINRAYGAGAYLEVLTEGMTLVRISETAPVPEPATLGLLGAALVAVGLRSRRRSLR
jgi:hypothetical protein